MIRGFDISNHQGNVNHAAARAAGLDFVVVKATQGVSFADPYLAANRAKGHAAGLMVGLYQFADLDDALTDARWFLSHVGPLQPNEFLVLDEEVQQPNKVAWCTTWLQTVHAATGTWPLIYMNRSTAAGYNWAPVAANSALWLASYDNSTTQPTVPGWPSVVMKQYSDSGVVPGVTGTCDVDVFYGSAAQLAAYGTPGGTDMPLTAQDVQAVVDGLLHTDLTRQGTDEQGKPIAGTVNLAAFLQWSDANFAGVRSKVASASSPQAVADAVVQAIGTLPAVDAQKVSDLVIAQLGQRISNPPSAA